jgi:hypothetical protein
MAGASTADAGSSADVAMPAASEVTRTTAAVDFTGLRVEVSTVAADFMAAVAADSTVAGVVAADTGNRHWN